MTPEGLRATTETVEFVVPRSLQGVRLDRAVSMLAGLSRSQAAHLVEGGGVKLGGRVASSRSTVLREGDLVEASLLPSEADGPVADRSVEFAVVYEDSEILVIDKPAGLVVHHGAGHQRGTLVDGLVAQFKDIAELGQQGVGDATRPGIVHRLDRDTSGLMVVARTPGAFRSLSDQLRRHQAGRIYLALVSGALEDDRGLVDAPIGRSNRQPTRMAVSSSGRPAQTEFRVLERYGRPYPSTLIEASLRTGRTHQVRVHMAAVGHPVVGDRRYGVASPPSVWFSEQVHQDRFFLHAHQLEIDHPIGGERRSWTSPLPPDLYDVLVSLRGDQGSDAAEDTPTS